MLRNITYVIGAAALLASPLTLHAQVCQANAAPPSIGILPPAESPDPPDRGIMAWINGTSVFTPYYAPMTPISTRWDVVRYVPYYPGYCKSSVRDLPPGVAGSGWLVPPGPGLQPGPAVVQGQTDFNGYNGGPRDEAALMRLGGTGAYQPVNGAPDLLDALHGVPRPHP